MLHSLRQQLFLALRMNAKTPVVTVIVVLSLALGIAANVVVFSVMSSWLLRPLPYRAAEQLVLVFENHRANRDDTESVAPANYFDWQDQVTTLESWMASEFSTANLTGSERPRQLTVSRVTPNFFSELGSSTLLGRTFGPGDGAAGQKTVVLSEFLWRDHFASQPDIVGRTVTLNGIAHSVVGVVPETFDFLLGSVDLWIASDFEARREDREGHSLIVLARLRAGASLESAQAEAAAVANRLATQYPETNRGWGVNLESIRDEFPGETDTALIQILMAVVLLLLLMACVNVASLRLATTEGRLKEMAVRVALGARRRQLLVQLFGESLLLALLAGGLGTLLASWGVPLLVRAIPPEIPAFFMPQVTGAVLLFSLGISILAGLTFGLTPVLQVLGTQSDAILTEGGRGGGGSRKRRRLRSAFVMVEFALALAVLIGAALLIDVFHNRLGIDPGFDPEGLLTMELTLPEHRYPDETELIRFFDELEDGLATLSSSAQGTLMSLLPRSRRLTSTTFSIDGQATEPGEEPRTLWLSVGPSYFEVMRIPLLRGRAFSDDDRPESPPVVIVNARMAELHLGKTAVLGRRIRIAGEWREVVGVARDVAQDRLSGLMAPEATVYLPLAQRPVRQTHLTVRSQGAPESLALPVQEVVWGIDPDQPVSAIQTVEQHIANQLAGPNVLAGLLFWIGVLTLAMAAIGIYGVMAYAVTQQTGEIGLRMALGARPGRILARVTSQGASLACLGLLLGAPLAFVLVRLISGMLDAGAGAEELGAAQGVTLGPIVAVSAMLVVVGLGACLLPARRATLINPVQALAEGSP